MNCRNDGTEMQIICSSTRIGRFGSLDATIFECPKCGETYRNDGLKGSWSSERFKNIPSLKEQLEKWEKKRVSQKQSEERGPGVGDAGNPSKRLKPATMRQQPSLKTLSSEQSPDTPETIAENGDLSCRQQSSGSPNVLRLRVQDNSVPAKDRGKQK